MPTIKTLDDLINYNTRYNLDKITMYTTTEDGSLVIPDTNLFNIYWRYIAGYVQTYQVTQRQREYYRYRPYLLSTDVYSTPALGWLIMLLNDKECPSKFYLKTTVRLIPTEILNTVYDTIVTKSQTKLKKNWNKYLPLVGEET